MGEKVIKVEEADLAKMNKSVGLKTRGHPVNAYFAVSFILLLLVIICRRSMFMPYL